MSEPLSAQVLHQPSLTLYAFHLRSDINQDAGQLIPKPARLWEQLVHLGNTLQIPELQSLRQKLCCYQGEQYQPTLEEQLTPGQQSLLAQGIDGIDFQWRVESTPLCGSLSPFLLHDAYALDLTLFSSTPMPLKQIHQLNPQGLLLPPHIQASLGQTLFLYAEINAPRKDDRAIANACVVELLPNQAPPEFLVESKLLGNSVFEYGTIAINPAQQCHILVWLNHNPLPPEISEVSKRLLYLLSCRHKILYAYHQSRWCAHQAKRLYRDLDQNMVQKFNQIAQGPDHLQKFQVLLRTQLLQLAFEYTRYLRDISDHATTIQTNLENYQSQMAKLAKLSENNLTFLQQFSDLTQNKFLRQIQVDQDYLTPGQALFQQLIDTIRGLAELEQAEGDRRLERTIQVVGVGLGVGAIFGSSSTFIDRHWMPPFSANSDVHPFISSLLVSLSAALFAGLATWWLTRPKRRLH